MPQYLCTCRSSIVCKHLSLIFQSRDRIVRHSSRTVYTPCNALTTVSSLSVQHLATPGNSQACPQVSGLNHLRLECTPCQSAIWEERHGGAASVVGLTRSAAAQCPAALSTPWPLPARNSQIVNRSQ